MKNYRVLKNKETGKYIIQVRELFFFWATLQKRHGNNFDIFLDATFRTYDEAVKAYGKRYLLPNKKDRFEVVTNGG